MKSIETRLGGQTCQVDIGLNIGPYLKRRIKAVENLNRLFVICDAQVYALHQAHITNRTRLRQGRTTIFTIPSGEKHKSQTTLNSIHDFLLDSGITRDDLIVAIGGGVTTDLAGYAASTVLRGVRWAAVPTTLLGMVDAAIGGKTGINHGRGKNLIGAFWQPQFVHSELAFLTTLQPREIIAGLGEVLKYAGLVGNRAKPYPMLDEFEKLFTRKGLTNPREYHRLVVSSSAYKLNIVHKDERDAGRRMVLNFGHTFGHGIEAALGYGRLRHGEGVILGIIAALYLGFRLGYDSDSLRRYHRLARTMLPLIPKRKLERSAIIDAMRLDKKRTGSGLRFVLIERPGRPILCDKADRRTVEAAIDDMLKDYRTHGGGDAPSTRS